MIISESSFSFLVMSRLIYEWFVMLQMLLECKFEQVYICYWYLSIRINRTVCCRHLVYATNPCCFLTTTFSFSSFYLFFPQKTWWDRALLPIISWRRVKVTMFVASVPPPWSSELLYWIVNFRQQAASYIICNTLTCTSFGGRYICYCDVFLS